MIAAVVVAKIRGLLAEGTLSQRTIARQLGVSRGTVGVIARGKRPNYADRVDRASVAVVAPADPPQRCPGCGGMVWMPCRLCRIRAAKQNRRLFGDDQQPIAPAASA